MTRILTAFALLVAPALASAGEVTVPYGGYVDLDNGSVATEANCRWGEVDCAGMDFKVRAFRRRSPATALEFKAPVPMAKTALEVDQVEADDLSGMNTYKSAYGFLPTTLVVTTGTRTWTVALVSETESEVTLSYALVGDARTAGLDDRDSAVVVAAAP